VASPLRDALLRKIEPLARRVLPALGIADRIALAPRPVLAPAPVLRTESA
jgi:hypothetical protein